MTYRSTIQIVQTEILINFNIKQKKKKKDFLWLLPAFRIYSISSTWLTGPSMINIAACLTSTPLLLTQSSSHTRLFSIFPVWQVLCCLWEFTHAVSPFLEQLSLPSSTCQTLADSLSWLQCHLFQGAFLDLPSK